MEAIENLHSYRVYTYGKVAATLATVGVTYATGSLAAAAGVVGLSILFASQKLTTAFQPKSLLSHSFVKLALSAALATIAAVAYLSIAGVPLIAAEVAYIASLFLIPTLAEICIEAASTALSSKKISPLIQWMNQRADYRDTEVEKAGQKALEMIEKHSVLPLLLNFEEVPAKQRRGVDWEAFQAIEDFEQRAKVIIAKWNLDKGYSFFLSALDKELVRCSVSPLKPDEEEALTEIQQQVKEMFIEAMSPFLHRGSIYALIRVSGLLTLDILRSVAEHYKGLHVFSLLLADALLRVNEDQHKAEGQKILQSLVEEGCGPAMWLLVDEGEEFGFPKAFIESTRKLLLESNAEFRRQHPN